MPRRVLNDELLRIIKELRDKGYGYKRIRKYLKEHYGTEPSNSTLHCWVRDILGDQRTYGGEEIPWSAEECIKDPVKAKYLAYLIGVGLSDGNVYSDKKGHYKFRLEAKDKAFINEVRNALKAIGLRPSKAYFTKRKRYYMEVYSKRFYSFMLMIKKCPEIAKEYIKGHEIAFLKGFYEGDGNWRESNVRFFNTDPRKIALVTWALERAGFRYRVGVRRPHNSRVTEGNKVRIIKGSKPVIYISLNSENTKRFLALTEPCIKKGETRRTPPKATQAFISAYKANYSIGIDVILIKVITPSLS